MTGSISSVKVPSTPHRPLEAFIASIEQSEASVARHRLSRPRDDRGDQRPDPAPRSQGRRSFARPGTRTSPTSSESTGSSSTTSRGTSPGRCCDRAATASASRRRIDAHGEVVLAARRRGGHRGLRPESRRATSRRSPSACSSRTSTRPTRSSWPASCADASQTPHCRSPTRSPRSGASTSARARRSPTPTSSR